MKKLTIALVAIIIVSFSACTNVETVEEAAAEEAQGNSKNDFLALLAGNDYKMGEGEDMVKVSFDLENYMNDCGDIGQFGWVGNYWADGPLFSVDVNLQEKELTTHHISDKCKIESKGTYKIKYIDDNTISLTVINSDYNSFFDNQGTFMLKK
jgi:hypothetical protein